MRVLVTYFAPFGTDTLNASALAAKLLPEELPGAEIRKTDLPVAFYGAEEALEAAIKAYSPDLVLCTGQAEGTSELHLERVAINMRDAIMRVLRRIRSPLCRTARQRISPPFP